MDSWIKTIRKNGWRSYKTLVSTLVLMDSWIKTLLILLYFGHLARFNPCFNGFMDKDKRRSHAQTSAMERFNPCFNGFMDKDLVAFSAVAALMTVSTLVLMDSWIKTGTLAAVGLAVNLFQPLF